MNTRFKQASVKPQPELRGRQLSTAQPNLIPKNQAHSVHVRSNAEAAEYNNTGFNWKKVDIRDNKN